MCKKYNVLPLNERLQYSISFYKEFKEMNQIYSALWPIMDETVKKYKRLTEFEHENIDDYEYYKKLYESVKNYNHIINLTSGSIDKLDEYKIGDYPSLDKRNKIDGQVHKLNKELIKSLRALVNILNKWN